MPLKDSIEVPLMLLHSVILCHDMWSNYPDNKVYGANIEPIWGRQNPGGLHVGPMNFATWVGHLFKVRSIFTWAQILEYKWTRSQKIYGTVTDVCLQHPHQSCSDILDEYVFVTPMTTVYNGRHSTLGRDDYHSAANTLTTSKELGTTN